MKFPITFPLPFYEQDGTGGVQGAEKIITAEGDKGAPADKGGDKVGDGDKGGTFLDSPPGDKQQAAPANWPDNWRELAAGGDKKAAKALERIASPADLYKSWSEAREKISKGLKAPEMPPADDAEGMKLWRKEMGIPETPDGYEIPKTVKELVTDEDKPVITAFTAEMHKRGWSQKQVSDGLEWYYDFVATQEGGLDTRDKEAKSAVEEELRGEWGRDFKANSTALASFAKEMFGADVPWQHARLPVDPKLGALSGQKLGNISGFMKNVFNAALLVKGEVTHVDSETASKVEDEYQTLKKRSGAEDFTQAERKRMVELADARIKAGKPT